MSEQRDAGEGPVGTEAADPVEAQTEEGQESVPGSTDDGDLEAVAPADQDDSEESDESDAPDESGESEEDVAASVDESITSDASDEHEARGASGDGDGAPRRAHRARGPAFAAVTALVVLVASAAGYYTTVPGTVKVPSRVARLVVTHPGIKEFDVKPKAREKVSPSSSGIAALKDAAKHSPDQTGGYLIGWEPSSSKVAVVVAFVLPTEAQAATALSQLRHQQFAANSEKSNSLTRTATFAVSSIPGSSGALFAPKSSTTSTPRLALIAFRVGTIVTEAEVSGTAQARQQASTLATLQHVHLGRVHRGFTLTKMTYPLLDTLLWGVGTVLLVGLIAASPFLRRRLRARQERRRQEQLDRQLVLGSTVVMKHRR